MTEPDNPDYVTVAHVPGSHDYIAQHYSWDKTADSYLVSWQSSRLAPVGARFLARSRAAAYRVEYRDRD